MDKARLERAIRRASVIATVCCAMVPAVDPAAARDDGVLQFFTSMGAGAASSANTSADMDADQPSQEPQLTIRPRRRPQLAVASLPVKPGKVEIFEDRTLRRGDAVMTPEGLRVFVGSNAWPHTRDDFVALGQVESGVSPATEKVLATLDRRPGG